MSAIYQIPVLGGSAKKLIEDANGTISFSPDGKQFAFTRSNRLQSESSIIIANADGSGERKLATHKPQEAFGAVA